jgi:hypothetical protein
MTPLIEQLATDQLRGRRFYFAYATGLIVGVVLAVAALLAATG